MSGRCNQTHVTQTSPLRMYPVFFRFFVFEARSYYVLWAFALLLFLYMALKRCTVKYGFEYQDVFPILITVYCFGIIGALVGSVIEKLPFVVFDKASVGILLHGGTSSGFGILCGGLAGSYRLHRKKMALGRFADAVSLPLAIMLSAGRVGCLLEGCCRGIIVQNSIFALHFPQDLPGIYHFPSQPLEITAAAMIAAIIYMIEKKYIGRYKSGLLFALFLLLYGAFRTAADIFREQSADTAFKSGEILAVTAVVAGLFWLLKCLKTAAKQK